MEAASVRPAAGTPRISMRVASGEKRPRGSVPTTAREAHSPVASSPAAVSGSIPELFGPDVDLGVMSASLELYARAKTGNGIETLLKADPERLGAQDMAVLRLLFPNGAGEVRKHPKGSVVGVGPSGAFVKTEAGQVTPISGDAPEVAAGTILTALPGASAASGRRDPTSDHPAAHRSRRRYM